MKALALGMLLMIGTAMADGLEDAKAKFAAQDKALNAAYGKLKAALTPELFADVQEDQRSWVEYRDYMSEGQAHGEEAEKSQDRWEMATGLTEERIKWLEAWKALDKRKGWAGSYSDGRGGLLQVIQKGGDYWFLLSVVRGPSFHIGELGGKLRINGQTAWFETKAEGEDKPTWLTLVEENRHPGRVQVFPENAQSFHGARAYFDGSYLWTGELSAEDQKKALEEIKKE